MRAAAIVLIGVTALGAVGCGTSNATPGGATSTPTPGNAEPLAPIQNHGGPPPAPADVEIRMISASAATEPCGRVVDDLAGDRPTPGNCAAYETFTCPHANPVLQAVDRVLACAADEQKYLLGRAVLTSQQIATATAAPSPTSPSWGVYVTLTPPAEAAFARMLAQIGPNTSDAFAIVIGGTVVSTPTSRPPMVDGRLQLAASFTESEAKRIAASLGARP